MMAGKQTFIIPENDPTCIDIIYWRNWVCKFWVSIDLTTKLIWKKKSSFKFGPITRSSSSYETQRISVKFQTRILRIYKHRDAIKRKRYS